MIEDLTLEKLKEYGFDEMQIDNLINSNDYQIPLQTNKGQFFATSAEMKIYSGVDALQKILFTENDVRFPIMDFDLLPEYFDRKLQKYLIEQKALLGKSFNESIVKKNFIKNEIDETNIKINYDVRQKIAATNPKGGHAKDLKKYQYYIEWLNNLNETTTNTETLATPGPELESIKPKILILMELGIIDLLNQKFNSNNTTVAKCIGGLINENPNSIRPVLTNLSGRTGGNTNPYNIAALENAIIFLNDLKCTNEVLNLQNKLEPLIRDKQ